MAVEAVPVQEQGDPLGCTDRQAGVYAPQRLFSLFEVILDAMGGFSVSTPPESVTCLSPDQREFP